MEKKHENLLRNNRVFLVKNLDMSLLYNHMIQSRLLSDSDVQNLEVN